MELVSEIKLIRTDTTLDLSQKAEKVCLRVVSENLHHGPALFLRWPRLRTCCGGGGGGEEGGGEEGKFVFCFRRAEASKILKAHGGRVTTEIFSKRRKICPA